MESEMSALVDERKECERELGKIHDEKLRLRMEFENKRTEIVKRDKRIA